MTDNLVRVLKNDFNLLVKLSLGIVFLILLLSFGRIELALITFIPMAVSWIWTLGIMAIFGIQFTIFNIIISTFIFGLGIDYTILLLHMHTLDAQGRQKMCAHGAASVTVAAATTLAGLGILAAARHPVLASVGMTGLAGIFTSYGCAIVCVPALAAVGRWFGRRNRTDSAN